MHRRHFINAAAGALLLPSRFAHAQRQEVLVASPPATPQHHGRPRPIVLGDGIELIDYRIYPSQDVPRIIGEISSTRDEIVDSPVVSITFPELEEEAFAYAPPLLPVMRPGESNMIFGVLPQTVRSEAVLASATFGLCSEPEEGPFTELHAPLRLRIEIVLNERWEWAQHIEAVLHNDAEDNVYWTRIQGLVRDAQGRYAGVSPGLDLWSLPPGGSAAFGLWLTPEDTTPANPFPLLDGSSDYQTQLFPGTASNILNPGCPANFR